MVKTIDKETLNLFVEKKEREDIEMDVVENIIAKHIKARGKDSAINFGRFFSEYKNETGYILDCNILKNLKDISEKIKEITGNDAMAEEFDSHIKEMKRKDNDQKIYKEKEGWIAEKPMPNWPTHIERSFPKENE